jgi:lysophospholipid acyltransferase (LPLAT)-like uncharacterized protein
VKKLMQSNLVQQALPRIAAEYLSLSRLGLRMVRDDSPKALELLAEGRPLMVTFWHGRLLTLTLCWRGPGADILISRSRDGQMIARAAKKFGHGYIEGSTAKGTRDRRSMAAGREVVERLRAGRIVGVTPDGPRGPRMRASMGAIRLAQMAGVQIIPVASSMSATWRAGSWDKMAVPYPRPGGRGAFLIGDPMSIPADADSKGLEDVRAAVEARMNQLSAEADRLVGLPPVLPANPVAA